MLKQTLIATTALFAATFLAGPQAEAASAGALKVQSPAAQVELVRWGGRHRSGRPLAYWR